MGYINCIPGILDFYHVHRGKSEEPLFVTQPYSFKMQQTCHPIG